MFYGKPSWGNALNTKKDPRRIEGLGGPLHGF